MSQCSKCKLSHDPRMQCQFVETDEATPVAPAAAPTAEVTIVNISNIVSNIVDALGRLMMDATTAQNSVLASRVSLLGADYVRKQEDEVTAAVTAAVTTAANAAAPYLRRMAEAELAVIEARTRNEIKILDIQASRLDAEARAAARPVQAAHRPRRRR